MVSKIIALVVAYAFGASFTYRLMVYLDIGVDHYMTMKDDHSGPVLGAVFWPFTLSCLGLHRATRSLFHLLTGGKDEL